MSIEDIDCVVEWDCYWFAYAVVVAVADNFLLSVLL